MVQRGFLFLIAAENEPLSDESRLPSPFRRQPKSVRTPPVALASRADREFTFLPLQAGSDDVVPKSASWKARFWIEQLRSIGTVPRADLRARLRRIVLAHLRRNSSNAIFCNSIGGAPANLTRRPTCSGLDILRGPDQHPHPRKHRVRGQLLGQCLGHSKIDNLRAQPCHYFDG